MKNRKGAGYVDFMVSFVIFIGFLVVLFMFVRPVREPPLSTVMLDIAEQGLKNEVEILLGILPFNVNGASIGCFGFPSPVDVSGEKMIVLDERMEMSVFQITSSRDIKIQGENGFYHIVYTLDENEDFSALAQQELGKCENIMGLNFSVPRARELFSYRKFDSMKDDYYEDYDSLKEKLKFPMSNDFSFSLVTDTEEIRMEKEVPENINVYVRVIKIELFRDGIFGNGEIIVKVW